MAWVHACEYSQIIVQIFVREARAKFKNKESDVHNLVNNKIQNEESVLWNNSVSVRKPFFF